MKTLLRRYRFDGGPTVRYHCYEIRLQFRLFTVLE